MRIYIKEHRPGRYEARLDGELIVASSDQPFLDGCRALLARGLTGKVEMWDAARPYPRLVGDIATAAKLTVSESKGKATVVPWMPFARPRGTQK